MVVGEGVPACEETEIVPVSEDGELQASPLVKFKAQLGGAKDVAYKKIWSLGWSAWDPEGRFWGLTTNVSVPWLSFEDASRRGSMHGFGLVGSAGGGHAVTTVPKPLASSASRMPKLSEGEL
jgi:hypothetical protein